MCLLVPQLKMTRKYVRILYVLTFPSSIRFMRLACDLPSYEPNLTTKIDKKIASLPFGSIYGNLPDFLQIQNPITKYYILFMLYAQ